MCKHKILMPENVCLFYSFYLQLQKLDIMFIKSCANFSLTTMCCFIVCVCKYYLLINLINREALRILFQVLWPCTFEALCIHMVNSYMFIIYSKYIYFNCVLLNTGNTDNVLSFISMDVLLSHFSILGGQIRKMLPNLVTWTHQLKM